MRILLGKINRFIRVKENVIFWSLFIGFLVLRILLITGIPKMLIYGPYDDLFYAKAAQSIIHGQWMGPYDHLTLIKSPFYAFFLIGSFLTGLPLYLNETIFYIGACIALFFSIEPLIKSRWWRLVCFLLILFLPMSLTIRFHLRVYREFVYFILTLYVTAFAMGLFLRLNREPRVLAIWSIGLGLLMGAFMLTREEGIWIYPILFFLLISALLLVWLNKGTQKIKRSIYIILPVLLWYIPTITISHINYFHYGFWGVSEQLDSELNRVLKTLARIETNSEWHPAIQISKEARLEAYKASPTFGDFQETLEYYVVGWNLSDDDTMVLKPAWYLEEYGNGGGEIGNGHFIWCFRDVIAQLGYYNEGRYPMLIYREIADELEAACDNGELKCQQKKWLPATVGSIDRRHIPIIMRMFKDNFLHVIKQDYIGISSLDIINTWPAWPSINEEYLVFEQLIYNPINSIVAITDETSPESTNSSYDLRYNIIQKKEGVMQDILDTYQIVSLLTFTYAIISWLVFIFTIIFKSRSKNWENYLIVSIFLLGLVCSRLFTLTLIDATTSIPGIQYSASIYIFMQIFKFLMIYWGILHIKSRLLLKSRRNAISSK